MTDPYDQLKKVADELQEQQDNWLRAVAALAAHGGIQIIPQAETVLGKNTKAVICLPERQYNRLLDIMTKDTDE